MILTDAQAAVEHEIRDWLRVPVSVSQEFYFAGFAGTGKSSLIAHLLGTTNLRAVTATYTGKSAHVLRMRGVNASTIHSLIYTVIPDSDPVEFVLDPYSALCDADLLILDECSMIQDELADDLRSFGKKILVVGDPGQLPPVRGAGAFTRREPDAFLTEIHRQAAESPILRLATAARLGERIDLCDLGAAAVRHYDRSYFLADPTAQVICGIHRHRWAVTRVLREARGIDHAATPYPTAGEPILCCRNDREEGLYNGMIGTAASDAMLDHFGYVAFRASFEEGFERRVSCHPTPFDEHRLATSLPPARYERGVQLFDHGHVLTCHKSQGSEFPSVVLLDDSASFREDRHRWLYTGITRAADRLVILRR